MTGDGAPRPLSYRAIQVFLRGMGRVFWRVRAEGQGNVPATGPVILATTHESFLDPLIVGAYVRRHTWYMARRTLFLRKDGTRSRFRTWLGAFGGIIEVDRDGTGLSALRGAEEKLREGRMVLIFPEGTRSEDGEVRPFRPGVGLLAIRTGAQVVPVSLEGTRRVWGRGRKVPRLGPGPVRIALGPPARYDETTDPKDAAEDIRRRVLEVRNATTKTEASRDRRRGTAAASPPAEGGGGTSE